MCDSLALSVVICTYNRAACLDSLLASVTLQGADEAQFEVVVVDNNSSDHTCEIAGRYKGMLSNFRYFVEHEQGLSHARNRGWREAGGEYVAYVDDDARLSEDWVEIALDIIKRKAPNVFGGPHYGFCEDPTPWWWKTSYGSHEHDDHAKPLETEYLIGNNIVFRRQVLADVGGFDPDLGMRGGKLWFGEETGVQRRIRDAYPRGLVYYDPRLRVDHLVRPEKMTLRDAVKRAFLMGRAWYHVEPRRESAFYVAFRAFGLTAKLVGGLLGAAVFRERSRYPAVQNYVFERSTYFLRRLGYVYEQLVGMARSA